MHTRRFGLYLFAGLALVIAACAAAVFLLPLNLDARMQSASAPSTMVYDQSGVLLYEIFDPDGGSRRTVPLNEIPDALRQAVIATEDAGFYSNPGFSPLALLRAAGLNLRAGDIVSGASTITQQVARQLLLGDLKGQRTVLRKVREIWMAVRLTATLSKDDILALYLNETYFGNLSYGVESAARAYFDKPAHELSLSECALLAGIPQSPVAYNPLTHPEAARERQRTVLDLMVKSGYVNTETADRAAREPLTYAGEPYSIRAPHYSIMVRDELANLVGNEAVARGGLRVQTTLDWGLQQRSEDVVRQHLNALNTATDEQPDHRVQSAAVVALDHEGAVRALVGSPDYWDADIQGAVNCSTALRQPGSALKPFTYAAAFEQGMSPASTVSDVRTAYSTAEGTPYVPVNYDGREHGLVSLREALAGSYNIAAVQVLHTIGVPALLDMLRRVGLDTLAQPESQGLALTLGGAEVRLYDLTAAYGALAAGGQRVTPFLVERVVDGEGNLLYTRAPEPPEQIMDTRIAFLVSDVLSDQDARAAVFGPGSALDLPYPAAVKTGTTTLWRDNWTVGYTSDWTIGVWVGNADGSPMEGASGITGAAPIWNSLMRIAHREPPEPSPVPDGLTEVEVCALSGLLPEPGCTHRSMDWFLDENVPAEHCTLHSLVVYDARTGQRADETTPPTQRALRSTTTWPAEVLQWAIDSGLQADGLVSAPVSTDASVETKHSNPHISSPEDGDLYRISVEVPATDQLLLVSAICEHCDSTGRLVLECDGKRWHEWSGPPYTVYWQLTEGEHVLSLTYETASGEARHSAPVAISVVTTASQGGNDP